MRWKTVLFDLDGTLFDTSAGIVNGLRRAFSICGYGEKSDRELHRFIGPPLVPACREFYGMTEEEADRVIRLFREYYRETGVRECVPFDGAEECLALLKDAGINLGVATTKPALFAKQILSGFGFDKYFKVVCAAESDASSDKAGMIKNALSVLGVPHGENSIMVGDRKYDILGAKACGIPCVALATGFAEDGEYEQAGAYAVVRNYAELKRFLFENC